MNWRVIIDSFARKYLKRIPKDDANRIASVLKELAINPYAGDIEKMEGETEIPKRLFIFMI